MEKAFVWEASQEDAPKEELVSPLERDNIILEAALEWGADAMYDIRAGTLGLTLYVDCDNKAEASYLRKQIPLDWHGLYTVVTYTYNLEGEVEKDPYEHLYDPKLR